MIKFMNPGNAVRVTLESDDNHNNIGFIESKYTEHNNPDFVLINFGNNIKKMNVSSLLDITYMYNDKD